MPKVSDKSKTVYKNGMGLQQIGEDSNIRTVISVSATSPPLLDYNTIGEDGIAMIETDPEKPVTSAAGLVARTSVTVQTNAHQRDHQRDHGKTGNQGGKKLGHRRVGDDGFVTYKRFETSQLIGSIQLGLEYVFTNEANVPDRDLLYSVRKFSDCLDVLSVPTYIKPFSSRISCLLKVFHSPEMVCWKKPQLTTTPNFVFESMPRMLLEYFVVFLKLTKNFL